ncbi:FIG01199889: hypothetical protein [hydrothermal vent metagenome]|uniref:DUF2062 domain-containing protein n=1 Tax=hydrothermal vent metagenome TaxID=652676 RepID=A0A3B0ZCM2_9ZZZZ
MPNEETIRAHPRLQQCFGSLLHNPNIWHLNRRSVAGAFSVGIFMAFIPVPFQMLLAAGLAIPFKANLPISVGLVWITNPLTMPAIFYSAYQVGSWVMHTPAQPLSFEPSMEWLSGGIVAVWQPFLLGSFILAIIGAFLGYFVVNVFWRFHIFQYIKTRRTRRKKIKADKLKKKADHA